MAESGLSPEVERFLSRYIQSLEQLEVLLLLSRTAPRVWTPDALASELRIAGSSARDRLGDLERRGFCAVEKDGYRYAGRAGDDVTLHHVADAYRERRVAVIAFIFSNKSHSTQAGVADKNRAGRR